MTRRSFGERFFRSVAAASVVAAATPAVAQPDQTSSEAFSAWSDMRRETVRASELLRGDLTTGLNPVAKVGNLILNEQSDAIEYVLFTANRMPMPWDVYLEDGFVSFNAIDLQSGSDVGEIDVRMDTGEPVLGPEEITIAADEAQRRLVSRVLESRLELKGPALYEIEDLLIHPETGMITHFVIGSVEDALFSTDRRAAPAHAVGFRDGEFRTNLSFEEIQSLQPYDTGLL